MGGFFVGIPYVRRFVDVCAVKNTEGKGIGGGGGFRWEVVGFLVYGTI